VQSGNKRRTQNGERFRISNESYLDSRHRRGERCYSLREFTVVLGELWTIAEPLEIDNDTAEESVNNDKRQSVHSMYNIQIYNNPRLWSFGGHSARAVMHFRHWQSHNYILIYSFLLNDSNYYTALYHAVFNYSLRRYVMPIPLSAYAPGQTLWKRRCTSYECAT